MKEVIFMNQPNLGAKILELRKNSNMTQEDLAEKSKISARTIQRIEQGDCFPRLSTLRLISHSLDYDFKGETSNQRREKTMLLLVQLSNITLFIIVPILVLVWNDSKSKTVETEAKRAINFQISLLIIMILAWVLIVVGAMNVIFIIIGFGFLTLVMALATIYPIRNMIALSNDKNAKYILDFKYMKY